MCEHLAASRGRARVISRSMIVVFHRSIRDFNNPRTRQRDAGPASCLLHDVKLAMYKFENMVDL